MIKKLILLIAILSLVAVAFLAGSASRPKQIERPSTSMLCLYRDTALRVSPTGYIIFRLPKGAQMWVNKVESPFAYVSYFDGSQWYEGTVTAAYLGVCGKENNAEV